MSDNDYTLESEVRDCRTAIVLLGKLDGLNDEGRKKKLVGYLEGMASDIDGADELVQYCRDYNSDTCMFSFCDLWEFDEFIELDLVSRASGSIADLVLDVAKAARRYDGFETIDDAFWGYPNGYDLEIKSHQTLREELRDYLDELADCLLEDHGAGCCELDAGIRHMLDLWAEEDGGE